VHISEVYQAQFPRLMDFKELENKASIYVGPNFQLLAVTSLNSSLSRKPDMREDASFQNSKGSVSSYHKPLLTSKSYKRRNVYKSIVRHMHTYFKSNKKQIEIMLEKHGFNKEEIENAFANIKEMSDREKCKGKPKRPKSVLSGILSNKNIYVYILKESIGEMINRWGKEKDKKILEKNIEIYKGVCKKYYNKCIGLLEES